MPDDLRLLDFDDIPQAMMDNSDAHTVHQTIMEKGEKLPRSSYYH